MKPVAIILFAIVICFKSFCQKENKDNLFDHLKINYFEISNDEAEKISYPFSHVKVIDKRYDTSCAGYLCDQFLNDEYYKIATKQSLSPNIESLLNARNKNTGSNGKPNMMIVLRKFWLERDKSYSREAKHYDHKKIHFFLTFSADFFIENDRMYAPLMKLDTLMELQVSNKNNGEMLSNAIDSIMILTPGLQHAEVVKRRTMNLEFIDMYYSKKMYAAILGVRKPEIGVYMNFEEFKNNAPSVRDFQLRKKRFTNDVCINVNGEYIPVHNSWGYSNGENSFIKIDNFYYPLFRQGNSFSLFCQSKKVAPLLETKIGPVYSKPFDDFPIRDSRIVLVRRLASQIDMETGEVY